MNEKDKAALQWARVVRRNAAPFRTGALVEALNIATRQHSAKRSEVMAACAMILGQTIAGAGGEAPEIRAGILALIDGYAMESAVTDAKQEHRPEAGEGV